MPPIVSQFIVQPWALPVLVGIGSLTLGLIIPRRNGASWLTGIIFFVPHLFLDLLDMVHTKKFKYYGLITALLAIEAFFAFRAATVYYDVLNTRMPGPEMAIVCVIVFIAVFLCGYMVATHSGKWNFWRVCTMLFVIFHDWAGTIWMNYSQPILSTTSATVAANASAQSTDEGLKLVLTIGMCVLGLLPFIMGAWAEELRPELETELDEEVDTFTNKATRNIKRRAVERVLRMANRTDVVRLVQALPATEFVEFKQFVMPIIAAPGTPHNLVEISEEPATGQLLQLLPGTGQNGTGQPAMQTPATPATGQNTQPANRPQGTPATGQQSTGQPATTNRTATTGQGIGDQDKLDRTVAYLATHPQATDEELAAHLGMSRPASALFFKRRALEILSQQRQAPATKTVTLGMIESMMYDAITKLSPAEQADLRAQASSQSLAEFTHTLQQRYPKFAGQITEARVANVLAYDRQQQAPAIPATSKSGHRGQPATTETGQDNATGQPVTPATGHNDEPDNIIDMAGHHRTQRPTGQSGNPQPATGHNDEPDNSPQEKAATGQAASETEQDSDPQDSKGRIAAYRAANKEATQKQVGAALNISERTVRRYWKQDEAAS